MDERKCTRFMAARGTPFALLLRDDVVRTYLLPWRESLPFDI